MPINLPSRGQCVDASGFESAETIHSRESPISRRNKAGNMTIQGAMPMTGLASDRMEPSVGIVTGTPHPRKEREASDRIEEENTDTDCRAI